MKKLKKVKIHLECRGYCIIDSMNEGDKLIQLIFINDGKTKSQSIIKIAINAKDLEIGEKDDTEERKEKKKKDFFKMILKVVSIIFYGKVKLILKQKALMMQVKC